MGIILEALLVAWILSWFGLHNLVAKGVSELLGREVSTSVYWLIFFIAAIVIMIIESVFK